MKVSILFIYICTLHKTTLIFGPKGRNFCPQKTWKKNENNFTWLLVLKGSSHLKYCLLSFKQVGDVPLPGWVT